MKKLKVAIIGAGPSGFGAAEVLRDDDRFEITIFEKNGYVGGKCLTVFDDGSVCNSKPGGYEMGAVLVSKHSESYRDLMQLIEKYDIPTKLHEEKTRDFSVHMSKGHVDSYSPFDWHQLITKPRVFWKNFRRIDQYAIDYEHYSSNRKVGYENRPKQLNKNLAKKYGRPVNNKMSTVMQGFGYADLDDRHLSPPVLYYHQYVDPIDVVAPLYILPEGTQGIWSRVASTYPTDSIRLNHSVDKIFRDDDKVVVTANSKDHVFDYLIVATPLKPALKYLDLDQEQKSFLSKMKHNHYVTVLAEVDGLSAMATFDMKACTNRNKIGDVLLGYKRYPDSKWTALYLYLRAGQSRADADILARVGRSLSKNYDAQLSEGSEPNIRHWDDYFGHLDTKALNEGWYDEFEKHFQNKNRTLFVSSGLHMETVGASVEYATAKTKEFISSLS